MLSGQLAGREGMSASVSREWAVGLGAQGGVQPEATATPGPSPRRLSVEVGHELAVGRAGGGEVVVALLELEFQVDDLLFEGGDAGLELFGVVEDDGQRAMTATLQAKPAATREQHPCSGPDRAPGRHQSACTTTTVALPVPRPFQSSSAALPAVHQVRAPRGVVLLGPPVSDARDAEPTSHPAPCDGRRGDLADTQTRNIQAEQARHGLP
ncbi:hypothetical protein GCM10023080_079720 [Streptomyces pseudoechinosporeus]